MGHAPKPRALAGRQGPRSLLVGNFVDRKAPHAIVSGPFGMGRTHLARQVARDLRSRRLAVNWITGSTEDLRPFAALRPLALATGQKSPESFDQAIALVTGDDPSPVCVVDDAHLLSGDVAEALGHLVANDRCRLLLTARTGVELPAGLQENLAPSYGIRVALRALERDDVAALCDEVLGAPADASMVDAVAQRSIGRPRLVCELLLGALANDAVARRGGEWHLRGDFESQTALGGLLRAELSRFDRRTRDLIEAVALARTIDADALVAEWDEDVAEKLEDQGWLHVDENLGGTAVVGLAEPLIGELIADTLGRLRRRRHVSRLAALAGRAGSGIATEQAALIRNEAGEQLPLDVLREATSRLVADERFVPALGLAREVWERGGSPSDGDRLGRVLSQLNRPDDAEQVFAATTDQEPSDPALAALTLPRAENLWFAARSAQARAACVQARATIRDTNARAVVTAEWANLCARDGDVRAAREALEELDTLDDAAHHPGVIAGLARTLTLVWSGRPQNAIPLGAKASAAAEEPSPDPLPPRLYELILLARAEALCFAGRFAEACEWLDELHWCAVELRTSFGVAATALIRARLEVERGCIAASRPWLTRATHAFEIAGLERFTTLTDELQAFIEARHGDVQVAQGYLDASADNQAVCPIGHVALDARARAWVDYRLGDLVRAKERHRAAIELLVGCEAHTETLGVLTDASAMGHAEAFMSTIALLADAFDGPLLMARLGMVAAAAQRDVGGLEHHGSVLACIGSHLDATDAFAFASTIAGQRGDDRTARHTLARAITGAVGLEGGRSLVLERLRPSIELLTEREHLVARLAAEGLTSRDIAAKLTISVRTVDNLLGRVYRKLNVRGRNELTELLTPA